jgi:hypothetical protein
VTTRCHTFVVGRRPNPAVVALAILVIATGAELARTYGSLRVELSVRSTRVGSAPAVPFLISVCSNSLLPMATGDGRPSWRIVDVAAGRVVADSSHRFFTLELRRLAWGPRGCRSELTEVWDRRTWNQPGDEPAEQVGLRTRGDLVRPGRYRIEAFWTGLEKRSMEVELTS